MENKETIQKYINNFRIHISGVLKPDIGISTTVYPCEKDGAIIELLFGKGIKSSDKYREPFNKIADALEVIEQRAFGGNLEAFRFKGTNYIMEFHRLILIKDNAQSEWTAKKVYKDVLRFITASKKRK